VTLWINHTFVCAKER